MPLFDRGKLAGLRVIELSCVGPGPHATTVQAKLDADIQRIPCSEGNGGSNPISRCGGQTCVVDVGEASG